MLNRYRSSSDLSSTNYLLTASNGETRSLLGRWDFSYFSSIDDWTKKTMVSKGRMRGRYPPSPCEHVRVYFEGEKSVPSFTGGSVGSPREYSPEAMPLGFRPEDFSQYLAAYTSPRIEELATQAFYSLSDQLPDEVNIINFILELRDFGSLLPKISSSLSKTASDGFLNYSFGWAPFIDDLKKLQNIANAIESRLSFLRRTRGKLTRIGITYSPVWEPPVIPDTLDHFYGFEFDSSCIARLAHYESTFKAGGILYHELRGLDGLEGSIRGLLSALGFGNPLQTAWNAIPFSFIIDWIGDVSGQLRKLRAPPFTGLWEVNNFTYSVVDSAKFYLDFNYKVRTAPGVYQSRSYPRGNVFVKRYKRGTGLPTKAGLLTLPLSARQFALLAALNRSGSRI